jgi:hypothetical protein
MQMAYRQKNENLPVSDLVMQKKVPINQAALHNGAVIFKDVNL